MEKKKKFKDYYSGYNKSMNFKFKFVDLIKRGKFAELFFRGFNFIKRRFFREKIEFAFFKLFFNKKYFYLNKVKYDYFVSKLSFRSEKIVEVGIFKKILNDNADKRILEVGNVLRHHIKVKHDTLDKYESYPGIINEDVVDFNPSKKYDITITISTLEHVGWHEQPKNPKKILKAIENLKKITKKGGEIFFSVPFGQNDFLDELIIKNKLPATRLRYMRRVGYFKGWEETTLDKLIKTESDLTVPTANGIVVGYIKNE